MKNCFYSSSVDFKSLVRETLDEDTSFRALSKESVVKCRDLDEITTEKELRGALEAYCNLSGIPLVIRLKLRKLYGTIRLSTSAVNKLVEKSKTKVGWSVCSLRSIPT